jgi:hypothetical protein
VPVWLLLATFAVIVVVLIGMVMTGVAMLRAGPRDDATADERHPRGYYTSLGISIGAGFGVALGLVFRNLALGIAMGAGLGVAIGAALEQRNKEDLRPLTADELRGRKWMLATGVAVLVIGVAVAAVVVLTFTR